jgi:hypothetical protein
MFETLFKYPHVLARHREGPTADGCQRFLIYRANERAARNVLLRTARELLVIPRTSMARGPTVNDVLALTKAISYVA